MTCDKVEICISEVKLENKFFMLKVSQNDSALRHHFMFEDIFLTLLASVSFSGVQIKHVIDP